MTPDREHLNISFAVILHSIAAKTGSRIHRELPKSMHLAARWSMNSMITVAQSWVSLASKAACTKTHLACYHFDTATVALKGHRERVAREVI